MTPTNHTSSAFFGGLEEEEPPVESPESMDEQSSIDCSQLIESSTHTSSLLGGISAADASNLPARRGANASVLASVVEETSTGLLAADLSMEQAESDTIFEELRSQNPRSSLPSDRLEASTATRESTIGPSFVTMPSKTLHTSNVDSLAYKQMEEETDRYESWAIHVVLGVFCGLIVVTVLCIFLVIQNYGLVAMVALLLILSFVVFLMWFVDRTILSQDAKFKPMRNKIIRVVEVAKKALADEFNLFKRDWNELYLLTNEPSIDEGNNAARPNTRPTKKRRSVVFRMIKPAFRLGRKIFRGRGKAKKSGSSRTEPNVYHPPSTGNGVRA